MRRTPLLMFASALLAAFVSMPATSFAQTATGQITGTVRDATGAVMAGVKVIVTNQQTGLTRETKTGGNGDYVLPLLPVGVYVVTGEQAGFKTAVHSNVALTVDQIQRLDMVLATGQRDRDRRSASRTRSCSTRAAPRSATRLRRSR